MGGGLGSTHQNATAVEEEEEEEESVDVPICTLELLLV